MWTIKQYFFFFLPYAPFALELPPLFFLWHFNSVGCGQSNNILFYFFFCPMLLLLWNYLPYYSDGISTRSDVDNQTIFFFSFFFFCPMLLLLWNYLPYYSDGISTRSDVDNQTIFFFFLFFFFALCSFCSGTTSLIIPMAFQLGWMWTIKQYFFFFFCPMLLWHCNSLQTYSYPS